MNILLLKPKLTITEKGNMFPPLNLLYIGTILKKNNFNVKIIDQQAKKTTNKQLSEVINEFKPDVIGLSSMTPEIFSTYNDINFIKKNFPKIPIMLGGTHVTSVPQKTLEENKNIDYAVIGEGEYALLALLNAISKKKSVKNIKGIGYRIKDKIIINERNDLIDDLDSLPYPDYSLIDIDDYVYSQIGLKNRKFMSMITSRGCPFQCIYCSHGVFGRKVRFHSAENVIKHIEHLYDRYGVRGIGFVDDTFTLKKDRIMKLCNFIIARKLDLKWSCLANVSTVDKELLQLMKKAGCIKISYGVESGDQEMQKRIKKNLDLKQVENVFNITNRLGIETLAFFMIGLPGETKKSIEKTKKFAKLINPDFINVAILCPLPGSDIYEEHKYNLPSDWSRYQLIPYVKQPVLKLGGLSLDELQAEMKKFYRDFYLRPAYIISRLRKLRNLDDLKFYIHKSLFVIKNWF